MDRSTAGEVSPDRWNRLWTRVKPDALPPHPVDLPTLGEYAILLRRRGAASAARVFPEVAAHFQTNCSTCARELAALISFVDLEIRGELALQGVGLLRGVLIPLPPRLRGRPPEPTNPPVAPTEPSTPSIPADEAATGDVSVSVDQLRRALAADGGAGREAVAAQLGPIVSTWIRYAAPRGRPSDEVDRLTRQVFAHFWSTLTPELLDEPTDIVGIVRLLRETTTTVLHEP